MGIGGGGLCLPTLLPFLPGRYRLLFTVFRAGPDRGVVQAMSNIGPCWSSPQLVRSPLLPPRLGLRKGVLSLQSSSSPTLLTLEARTTRLLLSSNLLALATMSMDLDLARLVRLSSLLARPPGRR